MILCPKTDGPPYGYCRCGWPLFADGSCSDAECPNAWSDGDEDEDEESQP